MLLLATPRLPYGRCLDTDSRDSCRAQYRWD